MRLARVICAPDQQDPKITALVTAADLDVLQLDYRHHSATAGAAPGEFAGGYLQQMRSLNQTLFLDPRLRLITNAGGGAIMSCMESLGKYLSENGAPHLPICAVRGANFLARVEELSSAGIELVDMQTGQPLLAVQQPLLSAQVALGAGPLATAFAEGARIVVAEHYDSAAPFLAAAAATFDWNWDQHDALANVAVAADLTNLTSTFRMDPTEPSLLPALPPVVELSQDGTTFIQPLLNRKVNPEILQSYFLDSVNQDHLLHHADITADVSGMKLIADTYGKLHLEAVRGQSAGESWELEATFASGFCASVLFKLTEDNSLVRAEQLRESLLSLLQLTEPGKREIEFGCLRPHGDHGATYVRVNCLSSLHEPCQDFVRDVSNFALRNEGNDCQLVDGLPIIERTTRTCQALIARDVIDLSVDTRPAHEWT